MSEKKDEHVPAYLPDVLVAIELLQTGGAHHRYYDEVCNAVAEIERLRAENAQLRSSLDAMVKHVSNEELARAVEAAKKRIDSSEQGGGI